jgi:hypothetical protein
VSATAVIRRLQAALAQVDGIRLYLQPVQDLTVEDRLSRTQFQYSLEDADAAELRRWAPRVVEALRERPELRDVGTDQQEGGLQASLTIDRATASRLGITPQVVDDTLYDAFGQRQISTMFTQLNQYRVVLEVIPEVRQAPAGLDDIYLAGPDGGSVPLRTVSRVTETTAPLSIGHQGQFPVVTLSFNLAPGVSLGAAIAAAAEAIRALDLPASIHGSFQGTAQAFEASLANEPLLILAALITVYLVLGVLYESYVHPVTILSTLPSAGVGALLALLLTGSELNVMSLIGIILLIGIVKKNAIMMIDFALEAERERGAAPTDAIVEASLLRLTQNRHDSGVASGADVAQAEAQLEGTRAQAIDLGVQRAALEHAIAVLTGTPPAEFSLPVAELASDVPSVPVGVPSALLERRPDVATAERNMAAANAQIGVAQSAYYPTVTLSASGGFESSDIAKWLVWPARFWSAGPSVSETVYDAGRRAAQTAQARAAYDETVDTYRQTVLGSFQEVEDQLAALRVLEEEASVQDRAVRAARDSVRLTTDQYQAGIVSYLNVVVVNAAALADARTAVDIQGRRLAASVQLVKALGGGWDAGELPTPADLAAN